MPNYSACSFNLRAYINLLYLIIQHRQVSPLRGSAESWGGALLPIFHRAAVGFLVDSKF